MSHVITIIKGVACTHCGDDWEFLPCGARNAAIALKGFAEAHRKCPPPATPHPKAAPAKLEEWEQSWDVGASAATIYRALAGRWPAGYGGSGPGTPGDASDFGRCKRLLDIVPEWRAELAKVAEFCPAWKPLVSAWSKLEALYAAKQYSELYNELHDLQSG